LFEQTLHAAFVGRDVRIDLTVGSLEVGIRNQSRTAMPRTGDVNHVEVVFVDHPVQVDIDEIQTRRGSPMTQESRLDVVFSERLLEQRIVVEIDLADREVIGGSPVRIHQCPLGLGQRFRHGRLLLIPGHFARRSDVAVAPISRRGGVADHLACRCCLHLVGVFAECRRSV
jgi:hypothetical protein